MTSTMKPFLWLICSAAWLAGAAPAQAVRFEGRVVTFDGRPIAGAKVDAGSTFDLDTSRLLSDARATTDAAGRFALAIERPDVAADPLALPLHLHVAAKGMASVAPPLDFDEPDVGDVVLTAGQRLFGRVRDVGGAAVAGVRVVATDLLEVGVVLRSGKRHDFFCATRSNASGIFELPCALPNGSRLQFQKGGYEQAWLEPVAAGTPLELTMRETGWLRGRVLDEDGRSIAGAKVSVACELRSESRPVLTGADGSFRVPLDRDARWRITTEKRAGGRVVAGGRSAVMTGLRDNLEIIATPTAEPGRREITVRVVAKADGAPVPEFAAVALWEKYANSNENYREFRFDQLLPEAVAGRDGTVTVPGPGPEAPATGAIRIVADGFAPGTLTNVDASAEAPDEADAVVVELEPEARLRGVVREEGTGAPVAGARVWARPAPRPMQGTYRGRRGDRRDDVVTTAGDGTFELGGLGAGSWEVHVEHDERPATEPTVVDLETAERREGTELTIPGGATVAGRLEGLEPGPGSRVFLAPVARQYFGDASPQFLARSSRRGQPLAGVPLGPDGSFAFRGVALDSFELVLRLPSPPRLGGDLFLPIEPFRVRAAGIDRPFDGSEDRPGRIRGRIAFSHATTAFENLVVVAQRATSRQRVLQRLYNQRFPGARSFVGRDGSFEVRVAPGDYWLSVLDLATAVAIHSDMERQTVGSGKTVERELVLPLTRVDLSLVPAPGVERPAAVERVEVRFALKAQAASAPNLGGNDRYDSRTGAWWPRGAESLSLVLPEGSAVFLCRNEISSVRVDGRRWQNPPLGRAELDVELTDGRAMACPVEIGEPPEIPDDEAGEAAQKDADATGQVKGRAP